MKKLLPFLVLVLAACGCGRRFDFIDIAASEKSLATLKAGFQSIPDSLSAERTAYLRSQGLPVADVLVFAGELGEDTIAAPQIPYGYAFQYISKEMILDSLKLKGGRLYTDGGLNGRLLYLQDSRMSLPLMNKLAALASEGAVIGGVKPDTPLFGADSVIFHRTVEKVWMSGNVQSGRKLYSILKTVGAWPDMKTKVPDIRMEHRHLPNTEIYYLCHEGSFSGRAKIRFRTVGRVPQLWNPDTGEIRPLDYKLKKRSPLVWMNLVPDDECFVVFGSFADRRRLKQK